MCSVLWHSAADDRIVLHIACDDECSQMIHAWGRCNVRLETASLWTSRLCRFHSTRAVPGTVAAPVLASVPVCALMCNRIVLSHMIDGASYTFKGRKAAQVVT